MNILVTGSNGFIGKNLIRHLSCKNFNITGIDVNESDYKGKNILFIKKDLNKLTQNDLKDKNIETIIHLAQSPHYRDFPEQAEDLFRVNVMGTANLLECARKKGINRFIFASTGNVYKSQKKLLKESDEIFPVSFYAATKYSSELLAQQYSNYFEVVILRLFGVYGSDQKGMLIQNMIEKVRMKEKITLAKNIGLEITPINIQDCVEIIDRVVTHKNLDSYSIFNVAGNEITRLNNIINNISSLLDIETVIEITEDEPYYFCGDNSKIINLFEYIPKYRINSTIEEIIKNLNVKSYTLPI